MHHFEQLEKKLLGSKAKDKIMSLILSGEFKIGQKIPSEFELAEMFGVGRSTVREAVKSLASSGILDVRQGSGTFVVRTASIEDDPLGISKYPDYDKYKLALELAEVRLLLEPKIAAAACLNATEEEKVKLKELCDEVERLYLSGVDHAEKDIEFHTHIAKCSKNRIYETLIPLIHMSIAAFCNLTHYLLKEETIQTHRGITNAILRGDVVGAECEMNMHLIYNRRKLLEIKAKMEQEAKDENNENETNTENMPL